MANKPLYMTGLPRATRRFQHRQRLLVLGGVATLVAAGAVLGNGFSLAGKAQEGLAGAGSTVSETRLGVLTTVHELPLIGRAFAAPPSEVEAPAADNRSDGEAATLPASLNQPTGAVRRVFVPADPDARMFTPASGANVSVAASAAAEDRDGSQPVGDDDAAAPDDQSAAVQAPQTPFTVISAPAPVSPSFTSATAAQDSSQRGNGRAVGRNDDAAQGDQSRGDPHDSRGGQAAAQVTDPGPHASSRDDAQSTPQYPFQPPDAARGGDDGQDGGQPVVPAAVASNAGGRSDDVPQAGPAGQTAIVPLPSVGGAGASHAGQGQQGGSQVNGNGGGHAGGGGHGGGH